MSKLVNLTGSEKQIAWAESIRASFYEQSANAPEKNKQIITEIFNRKSEAKWWIDEIQNKAIISLIEVMTKCMDFNTPDELQNYLISKM